MDNTKIYYFKCPCGKELELHRVNQTDCTCGRSYWRFKDEKGGLHALLVRHIESDFKEITIATYQK